MTTIPTDETPAAAVLDAETVKAVIDRRMSDARDAINRGADHAVWQERALEALRRELFPEG